jgi:hypothetical protein
MNDPTEPVALAELRDGYNRRIAELEAEVELGDRLLAIRKELLDLFECPAHGECVPFAIEEVKRFRAIVDKLPKCWRLVDGERVQDVPVAPPGIDLANTREAAVHAKAAGGES